LVQTAFIYEPPLKVIFHWRSRPPPQIQHKL
jgi:hypothetical protein